MEVERLASAFKALGDPTRLRIFTFLLQCRCQPVAIDQAGGVSPGDGRTVGEVCCHLTGTIKPNSTLSFHLKELNRAGLIDMVRRGKHVLCAVNQAGLDTLTAYFNMTYSSSGKPPRRHTQQ